jgi:hypothetical protein
MTKTIDTVVPVDDDVLPALGQRDHAASFWRAAYDILETACLHCDAPEGALFACHGLSQRLLAARGVDQSALELARRMWTERQREFEAGQAFGHDWPPTIVLPCRDRWGSAGLLLLRWPHHAAPRSLHGLVPLSSVLAALLRRLHGEAIGASDDDTADLVQGTRPRASSVTLRMLLEQHEWNVARVSRVLGVTRMTVYNRMRRQGVPRERVLKTARSLRGAAAHAARTPAVPSVNGDTAADIGTTIAISTGSPTASNAPCAAVRSASSPHDGDRSRERAARPPDAS